MFCHRKNIVMETWVNRISGVAGVNAAQERIYVVVD